MRQRIRNILLESTDFESRSNINENFWKWFGDSKVVDVNGDPLVVYHGTNKRFRSFNTKLSLGKIWFSSDREFVRSGNAGGQSGGGIIMELYASIQNPAGWKEYDDLMEFQLIREGFDGVILPNGNGHFDGFVFDSTKIKSVNNSGSWDINSKDTMK